jgi:hypothetical protein
VNKYSAKLDSALATLNEIGKMLLDDNEVNGPEMGAAVQASAAVRRLQAELAKRDAKKKAAPPAK